MRIALDGSIVHLYPKRDHKANNTADDINNTLQRLQSRVLLYPNTYSIHSHDQTSYSLLPPDRSRQRALASDKVADDHTGNAPRIPPDRERKTAVDEAVLIWRRPELQSLARRARARV